MTNKIAKLVSKCYADVCTELKHRIATECELSEEQVASLGKVFDSLRLLEKTENGSTKVKGKRAPTKYNLFMREAIKTIRQENPTMEKTELMKRGAEMWQQQKNA